MRARRADTEGYVETDGVKIHYEVYGEGGPTILLLPTWTIIHKRFWKAQVPYLSRHHRVVTYDGPGNGLSDRPVDPAAYDDNVAVRHAVAVLDETGVGVRTLELLPPREPHDTVDRLEEVGVRRAVLLGEPVAVGDSLSSGARARYGAPERPPTHRSADTRRPSPW